MNERVIFLPKAGPRLDAGQVRAALAVPPEHPMLRAFTQLLDDALGGAVLEASAPRMAAEERAHAAGAIDIVLQLRAQLEELRQVPTQPPVRAKMHRRGRGAGEVRPHGGGA